MQYSFKGVSPFIGIPVNRDFPWQTTMALFQTAHHLGVKGMPYESKFIVNGSIIHRTRALVTRDFLRTDCTHLFFIDSDMSWSPQAFFQLLAKGTKMDAVGAAYRAKFDPPTFLVNISVEDLTTNEYGCLPINGMGLGFTVVQRRVIESLAAKAPTTKDDDGSDVPMIFRTDNDDGIFVGEDICFFRDIAAAGFKVWIDPSIELGHVGAKEFRGKFADGLEYKGKGDGEQQG